MNTIRDYNTFILVLRIFGFLVLFSLLISIIFQGSDIAYYIRYYLSFLCHQKDDITIFNYTIQLPLCYRCLGIYNFFLFGIVSRKLSQFILRKKIPSWLFIIGVLPIILDGISGYSRGNEMFFLTFITGSLFGITCSIFIIRGFRTIKR